MIDTPFGRQFVFDAHSHFLSRSFMQKLGKIAGLRGDAAQVVCEKLRWEFPPEDSRALGRCWIEELDRHGVDRLVFFHTLPGDPESLAAVVAAHPDRFVGYLMIDPTVPRGIAAAEKIVEQWRFRGIALFPAMHHFDLGCDEVLALLEWANDLHLIVFVHCGVLKVGFRRALGIRCDFDATAGNPLALLRHAEAFPNVQYVVPHLGSGMLRELLMLADSAENIYADTSGIDGWARYLPHAGPEDVLRQAIDVLGPQRLLFGSDSSYFPRGWRQDVLARQIEIFQRVGLNSDQVAGILGGNLRGILSRSP